VWDIASMLKKQTPSPPCAVQLFMTSAKWWTAFILATSIVMSIPPVNALIHGTTVVMGHGMGAEIGIDAMILFAAIIWILTHSLESRGLDASNLSSKRFRMWIIGFNLGASSLVVWLTVSGSIKAVRRYNAQAAPEWLDAYGHFILAGCGIAAAYFLMLLVQSLIRTLIRA
jgi:cbb3-type cytochrome oxidase subunit 1